MSTAEEMAQQTGWPLEAWAATEAELGSFWWPVMQGEIAQVSGITGTSPDVIARGMTLPPDPQGRPKGATTPPAAAPELDPFFDAVGRLVTSCQILEVWLYYAIEELVPGFTMFDAEKKLRPQGCIHRLRQIAALLPDPDRTELLEAMADAEGVFETRHQVVHGVHGPTTTPGVRIALRASMTQRDADGNPVALRGRLTRERMLEDRDRARNAGGLLQVSCGRWAEILGLDEGDDDTPPATRDS